MLNHSFQAWAIFEGEMLFQIVEWHARVDHQRPRTAAKSKMSPNSLT